MCSVEPTQDCRWRTPQCVCVLVLARARACVCVLCVWLCTQAPQASGSRGGRAWLCVQMQVRTPSVCRYPLVIKPAGCAGSYSVVRADTPQQLTDAVAGYYEGLPAYLAAVGLPETSTCGSRGLLVEEMMCGREVCYAGCLLPCEIT